MTKGMSLVAVTQLKCTSSGQLIFDRMIELWPIVKICEAVKKFKHRPAGTKIIVLVEMTKEG